MLVPWVALSISLHFFLPGKARALQDSLLLQPLHRHQSSPPLLPVSFPSTVLGECFFCNYLVVRLPYSCFLAVLVGFCF